MFVIPPIVSKECEETNARTLHTFRNNRKTMGFGKSGLFLLVLLFQLHLLSTHTIISQEKPLVTETVKQQNIHPRLQEKVAVSRRGGGGGSHASSGGHGGSGGHGATARSSGHGDTSPHTQGGGSVIPLYAAGAAGAAGGAQNHRNDNRHHRGSNDAGVRRSGLNYLLCPILVSTVFVRFM